MSQENYTRFVIFVYGSSIVLNVSGKIRLFLS